MIKLFQGRKPTPSDAQHAYLMMEWSHPSARDFASDSFPMFRGISLDVATQVAEALRFRRLRAYESADAHGGWDASTDWELVLPPSIYEVPTNVMVSAGKLEEIYGRRFGKGFGWSFWGPKAQPVTEAEKAAAVERKRYRASHMDAADPMKAVIDAEVAALPQPAKRPANVYLAAHYTLTRRRIGIFTDYRRAIEEAPKNATILEVTADGRTGYNNATLIRGSFAGGWGYASGYSPTAAVAGVARAGR